jgi:hypothetical protein
VGISHKGEVLERTVKIAPLVEKRVAEENLFQVRGIPQQVKVDKNDVIFIQLTKCKGKALSVDNKNYNEKDQNAVRGPKPLFPAFHAAN